MALILPYKGKKPKIDPSAFIAPTAVIVGDVEIGPGSSVWFGTVIRGDFQPIRIGRNSNIQDNAVIHVMGNSPTIIGDEVIIGHNALVHCNKIGNGTLIGMGSNIQGHTDIGESVVIGAGTLITQHKKIPSNSLIFGNPYQIVRALRDDEIEALHQSAMNYVKVAALYRQAIEESGVTWR